MGPDEAAALWANGVIAHDARCVMTGVAAEGAQGALPTVVQHGDQWLTLAAESLVTPLNARLAAVEAGFRPVTEPPEFQQWSHGVKRLLFMRARFPDDLREPISEAAAAEVMRLANEHFVAASYNALSLISTIGPLVMLPQPKLYYAVKGPGTLLEDAREATRLAGLDLSGFDLDVVRFESVPGFTWAGLGAVGGRGAWLQDSGLGVVVHELGHNLGLAHANFWNTVRPALPVDPQNTPFDADSLVGIDSIIGAGDDVEYGDPFDVMGSGGGGAQFSGLHKYLLGWIAEAGLETVTTSGVYRLAVHDLAIQSPAPQVLRVRKDAERYYWLSARGTATGNPWQERGLELHWNNWHQAIGSAELLDTTPGSGHGKEDAPLVLGRTFSDPAAQIFITPLSRATVRAGTRDLPAYDVAVQFGPFPTNRAPTVTLETPSLAVAPGTPVSLRAVASDADGDQLAYSWDFSDGSAGQSDPEVTVSWETAGDHVVRCEVSDLRGGLASHHVVIRVGATARLRIAGRVIDQNGQPLAGVRMHNGRAGTNSPYAEDFRWAYSDSDGRYTLTDLEAGDYEVGGELAGYRVQPLNFSRPLRLSEFTGVDVDFLARAVPRATVSRISDGAESSSALATFRVARTGPTNETLRVFFRTAGTATPMDDFAPWSATEVQTNLIPTATSPATQLLEFGYVDLIAGLAATNVSFRAVTDALVEGDETLVLTLQNPVSRTTITETETNIVDLPGWEVLPDNGPSKWFQTRQQYALGYRAEATALLRDNAPAPTSTFLTLVALETEVSENPGDSASFVILRSGRPAAQDLHIPLAFSGTATPGQDFEVASPEAILPAGADAARVTVRVLEDLRLEGNETIRLTLGPGEGYTVASAAASATITVVDNDLALVGVTAVDRVLDESNTDGGARVTFHRAGDRALPLEIDYLVTGSAEPGSDYTALPGRIQIPAGQSTASLRILPIDDRLFEGDETIEIRVGDSPSYNASLPTAAVVLLRDDEFPRVTAEATDAEADESGDPGEFLIRRTGSTAAPLVVHYLFRGSATHQADFVASGDRVTIPAGQTTALIAVNPIDDTLREDQEEVALVLIPDPSYSVGAPSGAAIQIADNGDTVPGVGFSLLSSSALESRTTPEVAIRISGNPDENPENAVTIAWEALGGSATAGTDYILTNGTLTFSWGDPTSETPLTNRIAFIPLELINDTLAEADETVLIRLRIAPTIIPAEDPEQPPNLYTNGVLDVFAVHTFTILDDDQSVWSIATSTRTTTEGSPTPARFTVRRTGRTNLTQSVSLQLHGLAAQGSDYLPVTNRLVLLPGQTSADVDIVPVDDPVMEFRENVVLSLIHAPGGRLGTPPTAEAFIHDDDGTIEFAEARLTALESESEAAVRIVRTGDLSEPATVQLEATAGTATPVRFSDGLPAGDFYATNRTLVLEAGVAEITVGIPLLDDDLQEGAETVQLRLSRGSHLFPLGGQNTAVLTLIDDDVLLSTDTNTIAAIESTPSLTLVLHRSGPVDHPLSLDFETDDFSANAGADYVAVRGVLEFPAGQRTTELSLPLLDDDLLEGDETFLVRFLSPEGFSVGEIHATITDDDCVLGFVVDQAEVDEDAGVLDLRILRTGSAVNAATVEFATVPDSAAAGLDFQALRGSLLFEGQRFEALTNGTGGVILRPGETNLSIQVRILNDSAGEQDETFSVQLSNPRTVTTPLHGGTTHLGSATNLTIVIRDNESPGRLDDSFQPGLGADGPVRSLALQPDGKVLVGGDFATFDGVVLPGLARLHADGFVDRSFNPGQGFNGPVLAVLAEPEGRLFVGGTFSRVDSVDLGFLARLEPDGTRSTNFNLRLDGPVRTLARAATGDGRLLYAGGDFHTLNRQRLSGVARLTAEGGLDTGFAPGSDAGRSVHTVVSTLTPDGERVLAGGTFTDWLGTGAKFLVRLLPEGSPDESWLRTVVPNGPVLALAAGPDGSVYLAGAFTELNGIPRAHLARLDREGQMDASFDPGLGANADILALGTQSSGAPFAAGAFTTFQELAAGRYAKLLTTGLLDPSYYRGAGANDSVRAVAVQPDGAILIGGDFTSIDGRPRQRLARLHAEEKFTDGFAEFTDSSIVVDESAGEAVLTVRRSGAATSVATLHASTSDLTAQGGADYDSASADLTFVPGQTNVTLRLPLRDDLLAEGQESFRVTLAQANSVVLGRTATTTVVIRDDETAVAFDLASVSVDEAAGVVVLDLHRTGPNANAARVAWQSTPDTATEGTDYLGVSGIAEFLATEAMVTLAIPIVSDTEIESTERFVVTLHPVEGGPSVGTVSTVTVAILDDDQPATHYTLTVERTPGGSTTPAGGRFTAGSLVDLRALPGNGFEFARWEGTVVAVENPLRLLMDRNHVLTPRFRARAYLETFETGNLSQLPWAFGGQAPWFVTNETAAAGSFAARSGIITNGGHSVLILDHESPAGGGSFGFRTASEAGWDFLEFRINGTLVRRWSGANGWQTFTFDVPSGRNRFEWWFHRDQTFGEALDTVWIDNLDLPELGSDDVAPKIVLPIANAGCTVTVQGTPGRKHVLERSLDLFNWVAVGSSVPDTATFPLIDTECGSQPTRFYRVRLDP
ncbi:MAG: PKD domain-containing protein [Verrucomicrobiales bacterium]|nr:PKD domain-containing protein [Verrucomicrobiales bacterium]